MKNHAERISAPVIIIVYITLNTSLILYISVWKLSDECSLNRGASSLLLTRFQGGKRGLPIADGVFP